MVISTNDQIHRRAGHVSFVHRSILYIWGGYVEHLPKRARYPNTIPNNSNDFHSASDLMAFLPDSREWKRVTTTGEVPARTVGAACSVIEGEAFVFGGCHGYENDPRYVEGNNNLLFRLDLNSFEWQCLSPLLKGEPPPAVEKTAMFHFQNQLYIFGGYGEAPIPFKRFPMRPRFSPDSSSAYDWPRGWYGNLVRLRLAGEDETGWEWVELKGETPDPVAGHTCVILNSKLFLFGGRTAKFRSNILYSLDLKTFFWSKIFISDSGSIPEPRSLHTLTAINSNEAILYGGLNDLCTPISDGWMLKCHKDSPPTWLDLDLPYDHGQIRCWHSASYLEANSELLIVSGLTQEFYLNRIQLDSHTEDMLSLRFGVGSLLGACLAAVSELIPENTDLDQLSELLPRHLAYVLRSRLEENHFCLRESTPPMEEPFNRGFLFHAGI